MDKPLNLVKCYDKLSEKRQNAVDGLLQALAETPYSDVYSDVSDLNITIGFTETLCKGEDFSTDTVRRTLQDNPLAVMDRYRQLDLDFSDGVHPEEVIDVDFKTEDEHEEMCGGAEQRDDGEKKNPASERNDSANKEGQREAVSFIDLNEWRQVAVDSVIAAMAYVTPTVPDADDDSDTSPIFREIASEAKYYHNLPFSHGISVLEDNLEIVENRGDFNYEGWVEDPEENRPELPVGGDLKINKDRYNRRRQDYPEPPQTDDDVVDVKHEFGEEGAIEEEDPIIIDDYRSGDEDEEGMGESSPSKSGVDTQETQHTTRDMSPQLIEEQSPNRNEILTLAVAMASILVLVRYVWRWLKAD